MLRGNAGAAVELAKQETDPFWRTFALALAQFANGERAEADAALKKLIDEDADDAGSQIASVYALRKEPEKMFEWLEHAWTTHDVGVTEMLVESFPARLQGRPALHRLRAKDRSHAESRRQMNDFFSELKRRNAYKVAVAYAVVGWLLAQVATQVFPFLEIPNWAVRLGCDSADRLGFPVALILSWAFELTPQGIKRTEDVDPAASARQPRKHAWIVVVIVGVALSVGLFFAGRYTARNNAAPRSASEELRRDKQSEAAAVSTIPNKSIAVLPFENLSSDKENAYFAEGIQDEILTRLSKIAALKVISRTSTQKYKSAPDNLREIGQQLGVATLLEGSVQKAGNAVHINVQLIKAATDGHVWAESYDRKIDDIFGVEKEVAQNIAIALNAKLSGAEEHVLAQKPTDNSAAYEAYLRGKALIWEGNEDAVRAAIQSYEEAVRLDPQFALAWAGLSSARSIGFYYMESTPAARAAAEQSLAKGGAAT